LAARDSGVHRLAQGRRGSDGDCRKEVPIIVASIAHDIWLGSTLTLAAIVSLFAILSVVARRIREEAGEG